MKLHPVIRPALVAVSATLFFWLHVSDSLIGLGLNILASLAVFWVIGRLVDVDTGWFCALLFSAHAVPADTVIEMETTLATLLTLGFYDRATRARLRLLPLLLAFLGAISCVWLNQPVFLLPLLLTLTRVFRIFWELRAGLRRAAFWNGLTIDLAFWTIALFAFLFRPTSPAVALALPPASLLLFLGLAAAAALIARLIGKHAAIFSVCFFTITLIPVLPGILSKGVLAYTTLYLPALGICLIAAFLINQLQDSRLAFAGALTLTALVAVNGTIHLRPQQSPAPIISAVHYTAPPVLATDATAELQTPSRTSLGIK